MFSKYHFDYTIQFFQKQWCASQRDEFSGTSKTRKFIASHFFQFPKPCVPSLIWYLLFQLVGFSSPLSCHFLPLSTLSCPGGMWSHLNYSLAPNLHRLYSHVLSLGHLGPEIRNPGSIPTSLFLHQVCRALLRTIMQLCQSCPCKFMILSFHSFF